MGLFSKRTEDRIAPPDTRRGIPFGVPALSTGPVTDVNQSNALRVSDAWACVRALADSAASLPIDVFRKTPAGRVEAGPDSRIVQLLSRPSPGSTSADLISRIMVDVNLDGNAFVAKFRSGGSIVQLACLDPTQVTVELRGQNIVYGVTVNGERLEVGPQDIVHVKGMSADGLRGLSPVAQCRVALGLSSSLQVSAKAFTEQGSRPSGILTTSPNTNVDAVETLSARWSGRHGGAENMHRVAVLSGDVNFTPLGFSADDAQFLQQRELSAREVARIFRVPPWMIGAGVSDSLTYNNTVEQNRAFVTHSLRPHLTRIEAALSADADLCMGGLYCQFNLDAFLRADSKTRSEVYTAALGDATHPGWLTRAEVRELEDLPPENGAPNVA